MNDQPAPARPVVDPYPDLEVGPKEDAAVGMPAIMHAMLPALDDMGVGRTAKLSLKINQDGGFDCMSCAWADPNEHRHKLEFCENGMKAVTWEATPVTVPTSFWADNSLTSLLDKSEYWLGQQGRLVEPVYKAAGSDHYEPISWEAAIALVGERLNALESPDRAAFYTSGRVSNEAAFLYQLFVRALGTNNLPDCSNMCHESSGTALTASIGVGKATVVYDDFEQADLIIVMGQNPGTNHPRMLGALEAQKRRGGRIVAVNVLPEAGLIRYKNPQRPRGIVGKGTKLADQFIQIRSGGDMALLQAVSKRVLDAEDAAPGTVLDHEFLAAHTEGLDAFREHLAGLDEAEVLLATGITPQEIDELADAYLAADRVIVTWAMGLTQQKKSVDTIKEVVNLLLLRGNMGKPGAGAAPIRGHSNVQGDRTMGIWEQMPERFLAALEAEFGFPVPRAHGRDAVKTVQGLRDGEIDVFISMAGNFVAAISDTDASEQAMRKAKLTVQVSTKLNRSHVVTGEEALILPVLGRTEIDLQGGVPQFVSVEDTVCSVHGSHGAIPPVAPGLLSEVAVVCRMAEATFGSGTADGSAGRVARSAYRDPAVASIPWADFERDYDLIRERISRVVPGFEHYNDDVRRKNGFELPISPRVRRFDTPSGKAQITVNELEHLERPAGRLILQTLRSHDQFNTTIYSLDDRYRGIKKGRDVVFVHPDDLAELGLADGQRVDVVSEWPGQPDRVLPGQRLVAYPTAKGCAAAYYPEANVLVPLESAADGSNTPVSKAVIVRLEPVAVP